MSKTIASFIHLQLSNEVQITTETITDEPIQMPGQFVQYPTLPVRKIFFRENNF